jgi:hypothetical protein
MPRSRIALWVALLALPSVCSAQQVSAITDYLKPIVSKIAADPNAGGWIWETNGNGGYLLRLAMDVTGDGVPELFVATSLTTSKHLAEWTVFDVNQSGAMRPYAKSIRLPADSVWTTAEAGSTALVYLGAPDRERERASDEKPFPVSRFTFVFPEIKEALTYVSEAEATKLRPSDLGQLPKLEAILLADYLTKPEAKWADVGEWKLDANGSFFRVEDQERAAKNAAFTPQVALSMLGVAQSSSASSSEQTTPKPLPVVQPSVPKKAPSTAPVPATPNEEPTSSTPWSIIVVLIVAATGLLWLLVKNRK